MLIVLLKKKVVEIATKLSSLDGEIGPTEKMYSINFTVKFNFISIKCSSYSNSNSYNSYNIIFIFIKYNSI